MQSIKEKAKVVKPAETYTHTHTHTHTHTTKALPGLFIHI